MSRTDQYIGLNYEADDFIKTMCKECDFKYENYILTETTLTGSPIYGTKWYFTPTNDGRVFTAREVIQEVPWSSGPMYFTCLLIDNTMLHGVWRHELPLDGVNDEFDFMKGIIYV